MDIQELRQQYRWHMSKARMHLRSIRKPFPEHVDREKYFNHHLSGLASEKAKMKYIAIEIEYWKAQHISELSDRKSG